MCGIAISNKNILKLNENNDFWKLCTSRCCREGRGYTFRIHKGARLARSMPFEPNETRFEPNHALNPSESQNRAPGLVKLQFS